MVTRPRKRIPPAVVTRIHKGIPARLYLREHRKHKGVSAKDMGQRMDPPMERESVLRMEREWRTRATPEKQAQFAAGLGYDDPKVLLYPPGAQPIEVLLAATPADFQAMIVDTVKRKVSGG